MTCCNVLPNLTLCQVYVTAVTDEHKLLFGFIQRQRIQESRRMLTITLEYVGL